MLQKHDITTLLHNVSKELKLTKGTLTCLDTNKGFYEKKEAYKTSYIAINGHDACYMYAKVKKSKAVEKFEAECNANLVLTALQGRYILAINF